MSFYTSPYPHIATVDAGAFDYAAFKFEEIRAALDEHVLVVTLDRPTKLNSFNAAMCASLVFVFELADADPRVRAVVLTGAGKAFCAGADLNVGKRGSSDGFGAPSEMPISHHRDGGGLVSGSIFRCRKFVVAAMNGSAVGVGLTMVLPADMRIIAETAKVALPFVKRGITLEAMSSYFLPRLVGHANALELAMTGDTFSPQARPMAGLWSAVLPADQVLPHAMQLAKRCAAQNSVPAMALNKTLLWRAPLSPEETHLIDSAGIAGLARASDAGEGVASFLDKRPPSFKGTVGELEHMGFYPWWRQTDISGRGHSRLVRAPAASSSSTAKPKL